MQGKRSIPSVAVGRYVAARRAWGLVAVTLATFLVDSFAGRALGMAHLRYALAVPAGIMLGPAGAVGFALGGLFRSLLADGALPAACVRAAGDVTLVVLGYAAWDWQSSGRSRTLSFRALARYAVAVLVGTTGGVTVVAVGLEALGRTTVVSMLPVLVTDRLTAALVVGPVALLGVTWAGGDLRRVRRDGPTTRVVVGTLAVAMVWLAGAYMASLVRRDIVTFSGTRRHVLKRLPDLLEGVAVTAFGGLYRPLLVATGLVAAGAVLALFASSDYALRSQRGEGDSRLDGDGRPDGKDRLTESNRENSPTVELTRRDAVVALGALGAGSYAAGQFGEDGGEDLTGDLEVIRAVAEVVYPSEVDVGREFVETFVLGRVHASDNYNDRVRPAVATLDETARSEHGAAFAALSPTRRSRVLASLGVDRAHSVPDGTTAQRIRYYLVNELLYALYTSRVGGDLLDHENPPGYPGGRTAYQEGPDG